MGRSSFRVMNKLTDKLLPSLTEELTISNQNRIYDNMNNQDIDFDRGDEELGRWSYRNYLLKKNPFTVLKEICVKVYLKKMICL